MKEGDVIIAGGEHFVKRGANELAAANNGDFLVLKANVVTGEEPINGGSGGGIVGAFAGETVYIFCWGNESGEGIGLVFVGDGELEDDAVDAWVIVGL